MRTRSFSARWLFGVTISAASIVVTSVLAAGCSSGTGSAALTSVAAAPEEPDITVAAIPAVDLAGLYITAAGQQYGQLVLADLDQGAVLNLPVDGYVATQAWARVHPATAAAFTRAAPWSRRTSSGSPPPCSSSACSARATPSRFARAPWSGR